MTTCDYHDLPVICGECWREVIYENPIDENPYWGHVDDGGEWRQYHPARPVHRIPDPEGIEGTAVVPCGEAT